MYRSSPFRSTLNTGYITCLGMCKVCTEAVHSVALCPAKTAQTPKHGPGKKDRKRARGVFQGRKTSRSAGIYIYIYIILPSLMNHKNWVGTSLLIGSLGFGFLQVTVLAVPGAHAGGQTRNCRSRMIQPRWPRILKARQLCNSLGGLREGDVFSIF